MPESKPKILILIDWFTPGYRAGGPIQTIQNFVQALGHSYELSVITTAYDHGSEEPYPGIATDQWIESESGLRVYYFGERIPRRRKLFQLLDEEEFDWLYLQSMFSLPFTLWPLQWRRLRGHQAQVLLAPRGMLHQGAMQYGYWKKRAGIWSLRGTGLSQGVVFQATDKQEVADIKGYFGSKAQVRLASNLPKQEQLSWQASLKKTGELRLVFASRVHPKKNLGYLLRQLPHVEGHIHFDIYGPLEDTDHVAELQRLVSRLDDHQKVNFKGELPPQELQSALVGYHFAALPTMGENFGHAIFEALLAGLPVIISDRTPWRNLSAQKVGWDLPLDQPERWVEVLQRCVDMDQAEYDAWSLAAWRYAEAYKSDPQLLAQTEALFA